MSEKDNRFLLITHHCSIGCGARIRTEMNLINNQALYHLSYTTTIRCRFHAPAGRGARVRVSVILRPAVRPEVRNAELKVGLLVGLWKARFFHGRRHRNNESSRKESNL